MGAFGVGDFELEVLESTDTEGELELFDGGTLLFDIVISERVYVRERVVDKLF